MGWHRDITAILQGEPEVWLAYLHGQQLKNLPLLSSKRPRYRGIVMQVAKYGGFLLRDLHLTQQPELKQSTYFLFAGTTNQMRALDQLIAALRNRDEKVLAIANPRLDISASDPEVYVSYRFTLSDVFRSLILLATRGLGLYKFLRKSNPVSVDWHFSSFCRAYIYLAYFYRILSAVKPKYVVTANDHNVYSRCMLAVAHYLDIKTVYLQHASVSTIFPALRVNYAFLDGQCALDIYRQCEPNQPVTSRKAPIPAVVLSGQKKHLRRVKDQNTAVGVALNALDNVNAGIEFIKSLAAKGVHVRLRWHPGQSRKDVALFRKTFSENKQVSLSDPSQETIATFMEKIDWLIAGNSSIHLEAALAGVFPLYYELTPADSPDYYGYVNQGLARQVNSVTEIFEILKFPAKNYSMNADAIRYYSATYLTEWEGREGELVAECLTKLQVGEDLPVAITQL